MRTAKAALVSSIVALACASFVIASAGRASADVFFDSPADAAVDGESGAAGADAEALDASATSTPSTPVTPITPITPIATVAPGPDASTNLMVDSGAPPLTAAGNVAETPPLAATGDGGTSAGYTGLAVGIRGGITLPVGQAVSGSLSDVVKYTVPIGIDVGYYLRPNFYIGAYFIYGFPATSTTSDDACPSGSDNSCSAQEYRFGVDAEYAFRYRTSVSPWVRGGIGGDVLNLTADDDTTGEQVQSNGLFAIEWAVLSAGIDFKPGYYYGIGPFVELAFGDYFAHGNLESPHMWTTIGLRARTGLFISP